MRCLILAALVWCCTSQSYCSCGPSTTVDGNLGAVVLAGDTKVISDDSNCPGTIGPKDLTSLLADLNSGGKQYNLTYQVTTCGNSFPTLAGAWIDWNQNFIFDADEILGDYSTAKNSVTTLFAVPSDAKMGTTRMRVQVQETQAATLNACANFPYGGTKDFSVVVGTGCQSGPATVLDTNLGPVTLKGDLRDINDQTNCPGAIGPINLKNQVADLVRNYTYSISWQVTTCGDTWPTVSGAWADYNRDGQFTKDELLGPLTTQQGTVTQNFTVPAGSYYGNITLRVQVQESNSIDINPCEDFAYGGTKDFTLTLKNASNTYCVSGPTKLGTTALGNVKLAGDTQSISDPTGCPGVLGPQDLTNQTADLKINGAYTISYSVLNCTTSQPAVVSAAWIDFDQNAVFSNWEQIVVDNTAYGAASPRFKVPVSTPTNVVKTGRTRLRLQVQERSTLDIDPCLQFQGGGTKDFSVTIA